MKTNELAIIKEISPVVKKAQELIINSSESMSEAVVFLSQCNKYLDTLVADREKLTKPINESLKAIRDKYRPADTMINEAIISIRSKMSLYQTKQIQLQKEKEAKIAARLEKGNLSIEKAMAKIEAIDSPESEVKTLEGLVKFRESQVLKITDELAIPREYLIVDERKILEALKAGKVIPGAEIEIKLIPINYRK